MSAALQYESSSTHAASRVHPRSDSRDETDALGTRAIPEAALYGVQTLRGIENFPITGIRIGHFPDLVRALAMVKQVSSYRLVRVLYGKARFLTSDEMGRLLWVPLKPGGE